MSQVDDYTIPGSPLDMAALAARLEAMFGAVVSSNRGSTAPHPVEGMLWWDTGTAGQETLKRYVGAVGWVSLVRVDTASGAVTFPSATEFLRRDGSNAMTGTLRANAIDEASAGSGVTVDGVALKDGGASGAGAFVSGADGTNGRFTIVRGSDGASLGGIEVANNALNLRVNGTNPIVFNNSGVEKMRMSADGALLIGRTSFVHSFDSGVFSAGTSEFVNNDGDATVTFRNNFTGSLQEFVSSGGSVVGSITHNGSSTSYNTSSDYRLKQDVGPLTDAIDRLNALPVHRFRWKANLDAGYVDGFLAHELSAAVPEAVHGERDAVDDAGNPIYQAVDQSKLVPLLTAALQEAVAKIDALEARVAAVEGAP